MRITIFGTGAMACYFGAKLAPVADVTLVGTWAEGVAAIQAQGITIHDRNVTKTIKVSAARLPLTPSGFAVGMPKPANLAIVLVKSWQTARVAQYLPALLEPSGISLTLQNGLGNLEQLGLRAYLGTTMAGATLEEPGIVRVGGQGKTHLVTPRWVVDLFRQATIDTEMALPMELEGLVWGKLSINCGINALSAILRVPNGDLLEREDAALLMDRAAVECAMVAWARGIKLPFADPITEVRSVVRNTASNYSSMLQDVLRRAPTEVDAINGAVVKEGNRIGVTTTVNEMLWRLMRAMTMSSPPAS
jgi:2-dehydropantoate 2-reductase